MVVDKLGQSKKGGLWVLHVSVCLDHVKIRRWAHYIESWREGPSPSSWTAGAIRVCLLPFRSDGTLISVSLTSLGAPSNWFKEWKGDSSIRRMPD